MSLYRPFAFFDPPQVLDASVTPIPPASSAPLQVIADSGTQIGVGIIFSDNTGQFIGVYIGAAGFEQLLCIIGNGVTSVAPVFSRFPPHTRVSLRAMANHPISEGLMTAALVTA